jgi:hypothetical protein
MFNRQDERYRLVMVSTHVFNWIVCRPDPRSTGKIGVTHVPRAVIVSTQACTGGPNDMCGELFELLIPLAYKIGRITYKCAPKNRSFQWFDLPTVSAPKIAGFHRNAIYKHATELRTLHTSGCPIAFSSRVSSPLPILLHTTLLVCLQLASVHCRAPQAGNGKYP